MVNHRKATEFPNWAIRDSDESWRKTIATNNPGSFLAYMSNTYGDWVYTCLDNNPWGFLPHYDNNPEAN